MRLVQKTTESRDLTTLEVYRRKLENKLQQNNVGDVWSGMKKITGFKQKEDQMDGSLDRDNDLNSFFTRFRDQLSILLSWTQTDRPPPSLHPQLPCNISAVSSSSSVMDLSDLEKQTDTEGCLCRITSRGSRTKESSHEEHHGQP